MTKRETNYATTSPTSTSFESLRKRILSLVAMPCHIKAMPPLNQRSTRQGEGKRKKKEERNGKNDTKVCHLYSKHTFILKAQVESGSTFLRLLTMMTTWKEREKAREKEGKKRKERGRTKERSLRDVCTYHYYSERKQVDKRKKSKLHACHSLPQEECKSKSAAKIFSTVPEHSQVCHTPALCTLFAVYSYL